MAGKLIIRRPGRLLPLIVLLLILSIVAVLSWLCLIGLPDSLIRKLELSAAQNGIHLKIDSIKLSLGGRIGFKAEGIKVYHESTTNYLLLAHIPKASIDLKLGRLFLGEIMPHSLALHNGHFEFYPSNESNVQALPLVLSKINASLTISPQNRAEFTAYGLELNGIQVNIEADLDLQSDQLFAESKPEEKDNFDDLLSPYLEDINDIITICHEQNWDHETAPQLKLNITEAKGNYQITLEGKVPSFNYTPPHEDESTFDFHLRHGDFLISYENDAIFINRFIFETIEPVAKMEMKGAYNIKTKELSFDIENNAPLLPLVASLSHNDEVKDIISRIKHAEATPPKLKLKGDLAFEETSSIDGELSLKQLNFNGTITQSSFTIGDDNAIKDFDFSFFYNNGTFNIDKMNFTLDDGSIKLEASSPKDDIKSPPKKGEEATQLNEHTGELALHINLPLERLLSLINTNLKKEDRLEIPEQLSLNENLELQLKAEFKTPQFIPGATNWEDFSFHLSGIKLSLTLPQLQYSKHEIKDATLSITGEGITCNAQSLPQFVEKLSINLTAATYIEESKTSIEGLSLESQLGMLKLDYADLANSLQLGAGNVKLEILKAEYETAGVENVQLEFNTPEDFQPLVSSIPKLSNANLNVEVEQLLFSDEKWGKLKSSVLVSQEQERDTFYLSLSQNDDDICFNTRFILNEDCINITSFRFLALGEKMSLILAKLDISKEVLTLPKGLELEGKLTLAMNEGMSLKDLSCKVQIPQLVRKPQNLPLLLGNEYSFSLETELKLSENEGVFYYALPSLCLKHKTGELTTSLEGNTKGIIRAQNGQCSIRPDAIDGLLDLTEAHEIIRDFSFNDKSQVFMRNFNVEVDYSKGLVLEIESDVEFKNIAYTLGAIIEEKGKESPRKDMGNNPFVKIHEGQCGFYLDLKWYLQDENGKDIPDFFIMKMKDPLLVYDNSPWYKEHKIKPTTKECRANGDLVYLDLEEGFVRLEGLRGSIYPAYSISMFYPEILDFLGTLHLSTPADLECSTLVFPIYKDSKAKMSGVVRVIQPDHFTLDLIGTKIPISHFSGFVHLSDDFVKLNQLNARCWGGALDANVHIGISGPSTSFDGYVQAQNMNMRLIGASYDAKLSDGLCNADFRFRSSSFELNSLQGYGHAEITNAKLMELAFFSPLTDLISNLPDNLMQLENKVNKRNNEQPGSLRRGFNYTLDKIGRGIQYVGSAFSDSISVLPGSNHFFKYDLSHAVSDFKIENGILYTENMKADGFNLDVDVRAKLNLDTLEIKGNLWPHITSVPSVILTPITFLSEYMIDINIHGKIDDIDWSIDLDSRLNYKDMLPMSRGSKSVSPQPKKAQSQ